MITGKACPIRRSEIWLRRVTGENALVDRDTGTVHLLNDTALAIWDLCDGKTSPDEMITAICELTHMHPDIVAEDVHRILQDFSAASVMTWTPDEEEVRA